MRNLNILVNLKYPIDLINNSEHFTVGALDFNSNISQRSCYIFVYKDRDIFAIDAATGKTTLISSIKQLYDFNIIVSAMFFNSVLSSLNIALINGDVLSLPIQEDGSEMRDVIITCDNELQCLGSIGSGLQVTAISPDTETIVFLTGDNILILTDGNFYPVIEADLFGSDQGEQEMVNVGWGKKETQFHGSEGKAAAKKNVCDEDLEQLNKVPLSKKTNISWRGDSSLFAVNYFCPEKQYRKVKIFDKTGTLQWTSEFLPGLSEVLAWRPSGNLIALTQKLPNKHVVCFIEKNGLRHGDFTLPTNIKIMELSWNSESTILSAVCVDESLGQSCVILWTTSNYHWYQKQRLNFTSTVVELHWDDVIGNLAHILLADGTYQAYQWIWSVDHSAGIADDDLAVVAVIDGCDVKLTPFKKCVIPPPMCAATVTLPSPAHQIMFSAMINKSGSSLSPNDLCVYMNDGCLAFVSGLESVTQLHKVVPVEWKVAKLPFPIPSPTSLSHWLWLGDDQLLCVACSRDTYICHVKLIQEAAHVISTIAVSEPVRTLSFLDDSKGVLVQLSSGILLIYQDSCLKEFDVLPEPCVSVDCVGPNTFARTHTSHLYVNKELIANNVTSYFCLPQFLIMTLSTHQLRVTTAHSGFKLEEESEGSTSRRLERGSTLVVVVGHSVVLQLPRGNLETVEPRALTLVTAARLLDRGDYKAVAQLLRRQRINLNLAVDHNPSTFLLSVPRFVAQVHDPQWLSVFLAELSDQDVTRGMYAGYYKHIVSRGPSLANKVERVCTALREAMTQTAEDKEYFMQSILSTYVRSGHVGEAISLANTDQALGYLTLLIDTDRLYEEALGVYNLEKALKIAGKSLKDPKEYVAYLNQLREMEPAYMRFTIDRRLGKPESALKNLVQCPERVAECLQYIRNTELYTLALDLFKNQSDMYREVCLLYGAHLQDLRHYEEAGFMYQRGGDVPKAILALTKAGCWRQCLTLAAQHKSSEELLHLQKTLCTALESREDFTEAADLCNQLGWVEQAISNWAQARCWTKAIYTCHTHSHTNLIDTTVKPALLEAQSRVLGDLRSKQVELDKHAARLVIVRNKKADPNSNFDAMSDIQSDVSSLSSFTTSSAGSRTTKNTRKAQRKLWSLKEGNPREEQALLYTITELIQNTERLTGEVRSTCLALAQLELDSEANLLQSTLSASLSHIEHVKHSVWPSSAAKKTGSDAEAIDPTSIDNQLSYAPASCVASSWKLLIYT